MTSTIKLLRSSKIYNSFKDAVAALNQLEHQEGQPVVVFYKSTIGVIGDYTDCILAVGIKNGIGIESYSIISTGNSIVVHSVSTVLPDVTESGILHVYFDGERSYWVYLEGASRIIDPIMDPINEDIPSIKVQDIHGKFWWVNSSFVKSADQFIGNEEFRETMELVNSLNSKVHDIDPIVKKLESEVTSLIENSSSFKLNTTLISPNNLIQCKGLTLEFIFRVNVIMNGEYVEDDCSYFCKRKTSSNGNWEALKYERSENLLTIPNCGNTDTIIIKAEHSSGLSTITEVDLHFVYPTLCGKINYNGKLGVWPTLSNGEDLWNIENLEKIFSGEAKNGESLTNLDFKTTNSILIKENDDFSAEGKFNLNEFLYFATPDLGGGSGKLSKITDDNGQVISEDFEYYYPVNIIPTRVLTETGEFVFEYTKPIRYHLYLKKTPVNSNNIPLTITFHK